jgi:hypothetical protein
LRVPSGGTLRLEVEASTWVGGRADVIWSGENVGSLILGREPARFEHRAAGDGYLRVEIRGPDGAVVALTNPIFVQAAAP